MFEAIVGTAFSAALPMAAAVAAATAAFTPLEG